jgi:hypothetical protein
MKKARRGEPRVVMRWIGERLATFALLYALAAFGAAVAYLLNPYTGAPVEDALRAWLSEPAPAPVVSSPTFRR